MEEEQEQEEEEEEEESRKGLLKHNALNEEDPERDTLSLHCRLRSRCP